MTGRDAVAFMAYAKRYLGGNGVRVELDENASTYNGMTRFDDYNDATAIVGIKDFVDSPDKEFSDNEVMVPLVGLFHEVCGHGLMDTKLFSKNEPLASVIGLNYYACKGSEYYYGFRKQFVHQGAKVKRIPLPTRQYFHQPVEIAAQYAGIRSSYAFLSKVYGEDKAGDLIRSYVEYRVGLDSECIDEMPEDTSVDGILDAFDESFRKHVFAHRDYGIGLKRDGVLEHADKSIARMLASCKDGLSQDAVIATLYTYDALAGHFIRNRGAFKDLDLSIESLVEKREESILPRPDKAALRLHDLDGMIDHVAEGAESRDFWDSGPGG